MKKLLATVMLVVTFFTLSAVTASAAVTNNTVKVGLRYGSSVMATPSAISTATASSCPWGTPT